MSRVVRFFEEDGPLAMVVGERYRYRPAQVELASDIAGACKRGGAVVLGDANAALELTQRHLQRATQCRQAAAERLSALETLAALGEELPEGERI